MKIGAESEVISDACIPVAAYTEIGSVKRKRGIDEAVVVPNNKGTRKKRQPESAVTHDHDYACTAEKYSNLLKITNKHKKENADLRKRGFVQSRIIKRKDVSIMKWKKKAKLNRKKKAPKEDIVSDLILKELQKKRSSTT